MMDYKNIYYPESAFGGFTDIDGTIAFYLRVNSLITSPSLVCDVGCGRGAYAEDPVRLRKELRILKGKVKKVIGIDVDAPAEKNPFLDEFRHLQGTYWPLEDESIDVCLCDNVLEHVEDPVRFFSECRRVVKQGGYVCIRTTNVWSYIGMLSRLIPDRHHALMIRKIQHGRKEEDVFPTLYRCNSMRRIRYMLDKYGFENCVYGYEAEPSYLSFSQLFYLSGVIHQKFAPNVLRLAIFAFGKKK